MTDRLIIAAEWSQLLLSTGGGTMLGVVVSAIFAVNFRLWNKYEADPRFGPQLICFCSYFLSLAIFFPDHVFRHSAVGAMEKRCR